MTRRAFPAQDLFGDAPQREQADGEVEIIFVLVHQTPGPGGAWLLRRPGHDDEPKWAPKSLVKRGEPPDEDVFTLPRWIAAGRGWL